MDPSYPSDPSFLSRHICEHFTFLASPWNPASRRRRRSTACVGSWLMFFFFFRKFETCWMMVDVEPQLLSILKGFVKSSNDPFFVLHTDLGLWKVDHVESTDDEDYTVLMPAELDRLDLIAWGEFRLFPMIIHPYWMWLIMSVNNSNNQRWAIGCKVLQRVVLGLHIEAVLLDAGQTLKARKGGLNNGKSNRNYKTR